MEGRKRERNEGGRKGRWKDGGKRKVWRGGGKEVREDASSRGSCDVTPAPKSVSPLFQRCPASLVGTSTTCPPEGESGRPFVLGGKSVMH